MGIHWSPMDSLHKGSVMQTFDVSSMLAWTNCWTCWPKQTVEQTVEWLVIWDAMTPMWCHYYDTIKERKHLAGNTVHFMHRDALCCGLIVSQFSLHSSRFLHCTIKLYCNETISLFQTNYWSDWPETWYLWLAKQFLHISGQTAQRIFLEPGCIHYGIP